MGKGRVFVLVTSLLVFQNQLFGIDLGRLNWGSLADDIVKENPKIQGRWKSNESWKGWLCKGSYQYDAQVEGFIDDLKADPEHQDSVLFDVRFENVDTLASGSYQSGKTLCIPFSMGMKIGIDTVFAKARAKIVEVGSKTQIKITILETEFGTMHFGETASKELTSFLQRILNTSFRYVWGSRLGAWISQKVTDEVNKSHKQP